MVRFIVQALVTMVGLWLADYLIAGVEFLSTGSLIAAAVILGGQASGGDEAAIGGRRETARRTLITETPRGKVRARMGEDAGVGDERWGCSNGPLLLSATLPATLSPLPSFLMPREMDLQGVHVAT